MEFVTVYIVGNYLLARIINKRCFSSCKNYRVMGDFRDIRSCMEEMKQNCADIVFIETDLFDIQELETIKELKDRFPTSKIIIKTSQKNKDKILLTLSCGVSGYIAEDMIDIKKVADVVLKGGFWLDKTISQFVFSYLFDLNCKTNENIKENRRLKNSLTQRELEVLRLITEGKTNSEIAKEIIVSTNTAKAHVGSILTKLSVNDRVQAAVLAIRANLF